MGATIWNIGDTLRTPAYEEYEGVKKTDVLIIGGGLCGLLCACFLREAGVDCMVAEAGRLGGGAVQKSMARITSQHGLIYARLLRELGREKAAMYLEANEFAIGEYRKLAGEIDCDFEERDAYVYSRSDRRALEEEMRALQELGFGAEFCETPELPFRTEGAVRFSNQAQFNPVKFTAGLIRKLDADGVKFFENTLIDDWMSNLAWKKLNAIFAGKIICTTNFPFYSRKGKYYRKLHRQRGYLLALENAGRIDGMYEDAAPDGLSLRGYQDYLILGGGGHRAGRPGGGVEKVRAQAAKYYPGAREVASWDLQDCVSLDGIPYIGRYARNAADFFVATGFNQWGMTSSMAAARLLADMVLTEGVLPKNGGTEKYPWGAVFRTNRHVLNKRYFVNRKEDFIGARPFAKKCTHGGCALQWNPVDHTWDCPCHGSRFDEEGKLLEYPALRDADVHPFSKESRERRRQRRRRKVRAFFTPVP